MTERPIGVTDVAAGAGVAEYRTRERTVGGNTVVEQYLICGNERVASWKGMACTFRIPGIASAVVLATLFNKTGSGVLVAVRRISVQQDYTTNSGTSRNIGLFTVTTAPTAGTLHTPTNFDSAQTHNANIEFRGGASADGTASAVTGTMVDRIWGTPHARLAGIDSQVRMTDMSELPRLCANDPFLLPEGIGVGAQIVSVGSSSSHTVVNCVWEEFTLP